MVSDLSTPEALHDYFASLWPPRAPELAEALQHAFLTEEWSRIAGSDWRSTATGKFEEAFARLNRSKYCLAVNNGSTALELCLLALGVRPGDRVIVPALSFVASATAISATGAIPCFVDVNRDDLTIDVDQLLQNVTPDTVGVIAVHLAGIPCNMDRLVAACKEKNLFLIEDCSHAHGSAWRGTPVGNFGDYGVFSMQQGKLMTCGEGAAITTNSEAHYRKLFSRHTFSTTLVNGLMHDYEHVVPRNARLPNLLGSLLLPQVLAWEVSKRARLENIAAFEQELQSVPGIRPLKLAPEVSEKTGYYVTYNYDPTEFRGRGAGELTFRLADLGIPAFRGHNLPMYLREPYVSGSVASTRAECPVSELEAPKFFINFLHYMYLGDRRALRRVREVIERERDLT